MKIKFSSHHIVFTLYHMILAFHLEEKCTTSIGSFGLFDLHLATFRLLGAIQ